MLHRHSAESVCLIKHGIGIDSPPIVFDFDNNHFTCRACTEVNVAYWTFTGCGPQL